MNIQKTLQHRQPCQELVDKLLKHTASLMYETDSKLNVTRPDGSITEDTIYSASDLPKIFSDDVIDIFPFLTELDSFTVRLQIIKHRSGLATLHPHTDSNSRGVFVLNYLMDAGGENVETIWWKKQDKPVVENPWTHYFNYDGLTEIERCKFEINKWAVMRADVLHSVENVTSARKSLSIGFNDINAFNRLFQ